MYGELRQTVDSFQLSVSDRLKKAEGEFLRAYRAHMVEVHRELQELRDKVSETQKSVLKDDEIQKLETESAWYRDEAAQLMAHLASMQKDKVAMQERLEAVNADRRWLRAQVKIAMKEQKLRRALVPAMARCQSTTDLHAKVDWVSKRHPDLEAAEREHETYSREAADLRRQLRAAPAPPLTAVTSTLVDEAPAQEKPPPVFRPSLDRFLMNEQGPAIVLPSKRRMKQHS